VHHRLLAPLAALVLVLATAGVAMADTSAVVTEQATVNSTLSLVLSTTAINYGSMDPGTTSAPQEIDATVVSNDPTGWSLDVGTTNFTDSRSDTFPDGRTVSINGAPFAPLGPTPDIAQTSAPGGATITTAWELYVDPSAIAGVYHATQTWTLTSNP
jgi:hypothetical protein